MTNLSRDANGICITPFSKDDVTIFYFGGSGGFYLFYILMLSGKFNCMFSDDDRPFDEIMASHWNIVSTGRWKESEVVPANMRTMEQCSSPRLFFMCNPTLADFELYKDTTRITIYTDIDTQFFMCKTKTAFFYVIGEGQTKTPRELCNSSDKIFIELHSVAGANFRVYYKLPNILTGSDYSVILQDAIETNGKVACDMLGISHNESMITFTNDYLGKHTAEQLAYLKRERNETH
jgi:hypothetical protein